MTIQLVSLEQIQQEYHQRWEAILKENNRLLVENAVLKGKLESIEKVTELAQTIVQTMGGRR